MQHGFHNMKLHKIKYLIFHCSDNCKIYDISHIPNIFLAHFACYKNMLEDGHIEQNM